MDAFNSTTWTGNGVVNWKTIFPELGLGRSFEICEDFLATAEGGTMMEKIHNEGHKLHFLQDFSPPSDPARGGTTSPLLLLVSGTIRLARVVLEAVLGAPVEAGDAKQ